MKATACIITRPIRGYARPTPKRNIEALLRVTPETAQTLQWLTPGNVIAYEIATDFDWTLE